VSGAQRFGFVQIELAGTVGVAEGRYLARSAESEPEHVLVVRTRDAPQPPRRRLRRARPKPVEPAPDTATVPLTTLTVVRSEPFSDAEEAANWLAALRSEPEALDAEVDAALVVINRAVHAHRSAALDPAMADASADHALAVRVGYGDGERLVDGRFEEAIAPPRASRPGRGEVLVPQERVAEVLGGRETVPACEALLLRARADLDAERVREAALQLRVGLEALLAELADAALAPEAEARQIADLATLEDRKRITGEAANEALAGELADARAEEVEETLRVCERVLRRKRAFGQAAMAKGG
jgi:hypothetical protein